MPETWTGNPIGRMHNKGITYDELAAEMGFGKAYISMILNGRRKPTDIRKRMEDAVNTIIQRRSDGTGGAVLVNKDNATNVQ